MALTSPEWSRCLWVSTIASSRVGSSERARLRTWTRAPGPGSTQRRVPSRTIQRPPVLRAWSAVVIRPPPEPTKTTWSAAGGGGVARGVTRKRRSGGVDLGGGAEIRGEAAQRGGVGRLQGRAAEGDRR